MASYPTGVFSPAAKNNGQVIQAAHINDIDGEVVAIETALLSGIAHAVVISTGGLTVSTGSVNVGGPSSVATLQVNQTSTFAGKAAFSSGITVAGNSTVTGNLQLTGNSTLTGDLAVSGNVVITGSVQASNIGSLARVKVTHSTTQALTAGSWVGMSWDTEVYDPAGMHSTAANSSRLTFADSTGVYIIGAHFLLRLTGTATIGGGRILLNSTTELMRQSCPMNGSSTRHGFILSGDVLIADTSDYITLEVFHTSASTCSVSSQACGFWARKVSS